MTIAPAKAVTPAVKRSQSGRLERARAYRTERAAGVAPTLQDVASRTRSLRSLARARRDSALVQGRPDADARQARLIRGWLRRLGDRP
jgi:hypothetical protein